VWKESITQHSTRTHAHMHTHTHIQNHAHTLIHEDTHTYTRCIGIGDYQPACEKVQQRGETILLSTVERERCISRQPPNGGNEDYDGENSRISGGLPSSRRRRRWGGERGNGREWRDNGGAIKVDGGNDGAFIKVENRWGYGRNAENFYTVSSKAP